LATKSSQTKAIAAAIDVGSHETVLRIAEIRRGKPPKDVEVVHRTLPLGSDTYLDGRISQGLLDQLAKILLSFKTKLAEYGDIPVLVTATSAFREATNQAYAVEQIRQRTGFEISVLPNSLETSLHLAGLAAAIENFSEIVEETTLILDIRAGSIQLSMYDQGSLINSLNFRIGALRVREVLGDLERHAIDYTALLAEYIGGDLKYYSTMGPKRTTYKHLIVIGGNVRFLRYLMSLEPDQSVVSLEAFKTVYAKLAGVDSFAGQRFADMPAEHRSLLLPTAIIIDEVSQYTGVDAIRLPKFSLSSSLLYDLAVKKYKLKIPYDADADLISSARQIAKRYRIDNKHAFHVEQLSLTLFDLTKKMHGLKREDRLCLQIAAILHNVGKYVAVQDDGSQTLNIIRSTELIGLSAERKLLVALLACFHNGHVDINHYHVRQLPEPLRITLIKLIAILAVANALDAGHGRKITLVRAKETERGLALTYESHEDVTLELWNFDNHVETFVDVYGLRPYLVAKPLREGSE